jgi:hypothetical protein
MSDISAAALLGQMVAYPNKSAGIGGDFCYQAQYF